MCFLHFVSFLSLFLTWVQVIQSRTNPSLFLLFFLVWQLRFFSPFLLWQLNYFQISCFLSPAGLSIESGFKTRVKMSLFKKFFKGIIHNRDPKEETVNVSIQVEANTFRISISIIQFKKWNIYIQYPKFINFDNQVMKTTNWFS